MFLINVSSTRYMYTYGYYVRRMEAEPRHPEREQLFYLCIIAT